MFPAGGQADADEAVGAARRAFPAWKKVTPYDRGRLLQKAASLIEKHGEELAQLITIENGKPIAEAKTRRVPNRLAIQPLIGMKTAKLSV